MRALLQFRESITKVRDLLTEGFVEKKHMDQIKDRKRSAKSHKIKVVL